MNVSGAINVVEYRQEDTTSTIMPPTFTSDARGLHNEIRGITFTTALILMKSVNVPTSHDIPSKTL